MGHEAAELSPTACWCWPDTCFDAAAVTLMSMSCLGRDEVIRGWRAMMCNVKKVAHCFVLHFWPRAHTHKNYSIPQLEYGEGKVCLAWLASKIPMTFCREYGSKIGKIVPCSPFQLIACRGAIPSCLSLGHDFKTYCWFQRWGLHSQDL